MSRYQNAIVIGASSGIGHEIAVQLAESGCKVAVVARREARLQELAKRHPGQVLAFVHDVTAYADQLMQIDPASPFAQRVIALRASQPVTTTPSSASDAPAISLPAIK